MTCIEVRDILSDLIDVRNGEIPLVEATRLSEPEIRADAESHLAGCAECRAELVALEEVGNAFADYSVGELPAQHFADYGRRVRERMTQPAERKIVPIRAGGRVSWWKAASAAAAAACVAFGITYFMPKKAKNHVLAQGMALTPQREINTPNLTRTSPLRVYNTSGVTTPDFMPADTRFRREEYNPANPTPLIDKLQGGERREDRIFAEDEPWGSDQLLGVALRATRDEDADLNMRGSVGLRVFDVAPNSVAYEMGVLRRDVILAINGMKVDSGSANDARKFLTAVNNLGKGAAINLDILREDKLGLIYIRRNAVLGEPKSPF